MAEPPRLTKEQAAENLRKAMAARTERAEFKRMLKEGGMPVGIAIMQPVAQRMKAFDFIRSFPKVGKAKALDVMNHVGISDRRRIQGLSDKQRQGVIDALTEIQQKPGAWKPKEA